MGKQKTLMAVLYVFVIPLLILGTEAIVLDQLEIDEKSILAALFAHFCCMHLSLVDFLKLL